MAFSSLSYFLQSWALWSGSLGGCTEKWAEGSLSPQLSRQTRSHRTRTDVCPRSWGSEYFCWNCQSSDLWACCLHTAPQFQQPALRVDLRWKGASWTSAFPHSKSTFKTSLVCWLHDFICIFVLILLCCGKTETVLCKNVWCVIIVIYIFVYV